MRSNIFELNRKAIQEEDIRLSISQEGSSRGPFLIPKRKGRKKMEKTKYEMMSKEALLARLEEQDRELEELAAYLQSEDAFLIEGQKKEVL